MKLSKRTKSLVPDIQRIGRAGDGGDGALLMRSGIPTAALEAKAERDRQDPRRVAFRQARLSVAKRSCSAKVSLPKVSITED